MDTKEHEQILSRQAHSQADVSGVAKLHWVNHLAKKLQDCILGTLTLHCDGVEVLVNNGFKR